MAFRRGLPLPWKPERGAAASYDRIREQARVQVEGRVAGKVLHELLPIVPTFGLCRLPEPDDGDIFFDLEGDPFAGEGGIEYLFGYAYRNGESQVYVGDWCTTPEEEKAAFERFIDFAIERRKTHPALHVYHYAPYEPGALKRLMGRYATREEEVDLLLRGNVLIDLYAVVRHAVRASVESYSIKALEPLYGFDRAIALPAANAALRTIQVELEMAAVPSIVDADKDAVQGYNKDDCLSTEALRDWLEDLRTGAIAEGADIARPPLVPDAATPEIAAWQARVDALVLRLMDGVPLEQAARSQDQQAMHVLAHILDWHRREKKATWWEYFRLAGLSAEELYDEKSGISGLSFVGQVGGTPKAPIHRYAFPPQDAEFRGGEEIHSVGGAKLGRVEAIDAEHRLIDIKKRGDTAAFHPDALFEHSDVNTGVLAESLMKLGEHVADHGLRGDGPLKAARDLLLRLPPNVAGSPLLDDSETVADAARRLGMVLAGVLPIQGPPGAGKTYTASRMIVDLVRAGRRVGVTANSHKVIRNVLDAAIAEADEVDFDLQCIHKVSEKTDDVPHIAFTTSNDEALAGFATGKHVVSGTGWMWARPDAVGAVDVLFVDEAAQMSLANVLAISSATTSLVLLGEAKLPTTAIATSTLELGIDLGDVETTAQFGPGFSVSSLRQRIGRSGRRPGHPAVMRILVVEEDPTAVVHPVERLRLDLIQAIAMVECMIQGWVEPPDPAGLHLSTLLHQTLALILQAGPIRAGSAHKVLCERGPFRNVDRDAFADLLRCMASADPALIEMSSEGELMLGKGGEQLAYGHEFYAVFETPLDYRILHGSRQLGVLPLDHVVAPGQTLTGGPTGRSCCR